jgi:hypothetical protein
MKNVIEAAFEHQELSYAIVASCHCPDCLDRSLWGMFVFGQLHCKHYPGEEINFACKQTAKIHPHSNIIFIILYNIDRLPALLLHSHLEFTIIYRLLVHVLE